MITTNKKLNAAFFGLIAMSIVMGTISIAKASDEAAPNGGTFTLKVTNNSKQNMVLFIDTNCARGPDYQQGVNAGQTRELSYSTYSGGSCAFERSGVRISIKDLTKTAMHWESNFVPAGWGRGELDGPLPSDMQFYSAQDGGSTLVYAPK